MHATKILLKGDLNPKIFFLKDVSFGIVLIKLVQLKRITGRGGSESGFL